MRPLCRLARQTLQSVAAGRPAGNPSSAAQLQPGRGMAGGHHHGEGVTHEGITMYPPARSHKWAAEGLAGMMWFWILYRGYNDWDTFVYGHQAHLEHALHEAEHGHGHAEEHGAEHGGAVTSGQLAKAAH